MLLFHQKHILGRGQGSGFGRSQLHRHRRRLRRGNMGQGVGGEAVVQQSLSVLKALLAGLAPQHHGNKLHAVPLRRGRDAVACRACGPGFQPRGPLIKANELVGIGETEFAAPYGVHPDGGKAPDVRVAQNQRPAHEGNVIGAGHMTLGRQARGVYEMGVLHTQLRGPVIHLLHEQLRHPGHLFRQGHGGVVAAGDAHRLQKLLHGDLLPLGQIHLTAAHGRGTRADGDGVLILQLPALHGLHDQKQGHHLCDAGRLPFFMLVFGVEHLPRLLLHQQRRRGLHRQLYRLCRRDSHRQQRQKQR